MLIRAQNSIVNCVEVSRKLACFLVAHSIVAGHGSESPVHYQVLMVILVGIDRYLC